MPDTTSESPQKSSKLAVFLADFAFLMAAGSLLAGLSHPVSAIFASIPPLLAGIGMLRKTAWAAYGYALVLFGQLMILLLMVWRGQDLRAREIEFGAIFAAIFCGFFWSAGRSLERQGARRGRALPWVVLACVFTLPLVFFRGFVIPTGSMEDTLLIGDHILVRTFPLVHPSRGDIVVFRSPVEHTQTTIKRFLGMPGDRIRLVAQTLYRNGKALKEPYVVHKFAADEMYRDNFPSGDPGEIFPNESAKAAVRDMLQNHVAGGEVVVPAGKYFVLGDNRDNSLDSRYLGFVGSADIVGKPIFIYDSDEPDENATGFSWPRIRWNRMFRVL